MAKPIALIVDDEPSVRAVVGDVLRRDGFSTVEAEHGEEALELVRAASDAIAVVVTDVRMPRMTGVTLAKLVRKAYPKIGILIMSGYADHTPEEFPFIPKPFSAEELSAAVAAVLRAASVH